MFSAASLTAYNCHGGAMMMLRKLYWTEQSTIYHPSRCNAIMWLCFK